MFIITEATDHKRAGHVLTYGETVGLQVPQLLWAVCVLNRERRKQVTGAASLLRMKMRPEVLEYPDQYKRVWMVAGLAETILWETSIHLIY